MTQASGVETTAGSVTDAVLALRDVVVRYSQAVTVHVSALDVGAGETLALIGPNGSGKSTLLRVMALLQAPAEGTVSFRGRPVTPADSLEVRRRMAAVFQQPLLADMRVDSVDAARKAGLTSGGT